MKTKLGAMKKVMQNMNYMMEMMQLYGGKDGQKCREGVRLLQTPAADL